MKILIESVGSYTCGYLIKAIQDAGHHCVASDITNASAGALLADSFVTVPKATDVNLWSEMESILIAHKIDLVIPSFDETLAGWAKRKPSFAKLGIVVIVSPLNTVSIFCDKWLAYKAFLQLNIPTPETAKHAKFPVYKPRVGRGGSGFRVYTDKLPTLPNDYISQALLVGDEYTVDCLFDSEGVLVYGVPRKRLAIKEGKSTSGIVVKNDRIINYITLLSQHFQFFGAINFQCFINNDTIEFIEINCRFGGGSALGIAATENWVSLLIDNFVLDKKITANFPINYGLKMYRHYRDVFCEN